MGAALRTISLRLRGTSTQELSDAGEDTEGAITSKSKLRTKVKALSGVDILTDTGAYKSTYDILLEISKVWKDMSDIDQAALLEIIAGKTRSNTAAAILSNQTDLEEAYVQALQAEGSALEENETYLNSIQGRIDLFNNAVQTMWSNALDSDVVKGFVNFGTILVKIIDKIGVIGTLLAGLAIGGMIKGKTGPIGLLTNILELMAIGSTKIKEFGGYLKSLVTSTNPLNKAFSDLIQKQVELKASSIATQFNEQKLTQAQLVRKASTLGLSQSVATLNAAQMSQALQTANVSREQRLAAIQTLGLGNSTKALTVTEISNALATAGVSDANIAATLSALGLSTANKGLAASFMALWTAIWPILAIMVAAATIYGIVKLIDALTTTTEEWAEQLSDLKSELSDVRSKLDSVNSELETTRDRMAELLAMDKLSFVEEEELKKLQDTEASLERDRDILTGEEKQRKEQIAKTFAETMTSDAKTKYGVANNEVTWWKELLVWGLTGAYGGLIYDLTQKTQDEYLDELFQEYEKNTRDISNLETEIIDLDKTDSKKANKKREELQDIKDRQVEIAEILNNQAAEWAEYAAGVEYGFNEEADKWLDYYNQFIDKKAILFGYDNAKTNAITRIFGKDEYSEATKAIQALVKQISEGADVNTIAQQIQEIIDPTNELDDLEKELEAVGLTVNDAVKHFTMLESAIDSDTVEGITKQYAAGTEALKQFAQGLKVLYEDWEGNQEYIGFDDLFEFDKKTDRWVAQADEVAKVVGNAGAQAREEFTKLIEEVKNSESKVNWDNIIKRFDLSGVRAGFQFLESSVSEINKSLFVGLDSEINGLIDTFDELGTALENVANSFDLVKQAEAEMQHSGHLSVQTALDLIASTEDWTQVLTIENGIIKLNKNATDNLIRAKLNQIRTNLELKLKELEAAYAQAVAAESGETLAKTLEESTNKAVVSLAANMAYLVEVMKGQEQGLDWAVIESNANAAKQSAEESLSYTPARTQPTKSSEEIAQEIEDVKLQITLLETVDTPKEFENNYYSDKVSGGADTEEDVAKNAFQEAMDYWENRISANQAKYEQIQNEIDLIEKKGGKAGKEYYEEQIKLENERLWLLEQQKAATQAHLDTLQEGSDEWFIKISPLIRKLISVTL